VWTVEASPCFRPKNPISSGNVEEGEEDVKKIEKAMLIGAAAAITYLFICEHPELVDAFLKARKEKKKEVKA